MVKHMIIWTLKEEYSDARKAEIKKDIKEGLEGLVGRIPGLKEMHIITDILPSSNGDLMMDSLFESQEALTAYSSHPEHQAVANGKVRPHVANRSCVDYEM